MIVDSERRPWVAFMLHDGGNHQAPYDAWVSRAASSDGTWSTAAGFPLRLVDDNTTGLPDPVGAPAASGRVVWIYNREVPDRAYIARVWDGKTWRDEEVLTRSDALHGLFNLVAEGDGVHVAYGGGHLRYRWWSPSGWGGEEEVSDHASGHSTLTTLSDGGAAIAWIDREDNCICFRERRRGAWSAATLLVDESVERLAGPELSININGAVASSENFKLAMIYTTGSSPPYKIKFAGVRW